MKRNNKKTQNVISITDWKKTNKKIKTYNEQHTSNPSTSTENEDMDLTGMLIW